MRSLFTLPRLKIVALATTLFCLMVSDATAQVRVRGYTRKDGTYVKPHYRSRPDGNFHNNWSTAGNVNPYTGKVGTRTQPPDGYGRGRYRSSYGSSSYGRTFSGSNPYSSGEPNSAVDSPLLPRIPVFFELADFQSSTGTNPFVATRWDEAAEARVVELTQHLAGVRLIIEDGATPEWLRIVRSFQVLSALDLNHLPADVRAVVNARLHAINQVTSRYVLVNAENFQRMPITDVKEILSNLTELASLRVADGRLATSKNQ